MKATRRMALEEEEIGSLKAAPLAFQWGGGPNYRSDGGYGVRRRTFALALGRTKMGKSGPTLGAAMFDSSIGLLLLLAVFACAALAVSTRYRTDHPLADLMRWAHAHHWMHRRH
jgi:hypothetical protein